MEVMRGFQRLQHGKKIGAFGSVQELYIIALPGIGMFLTETFLIKEITGSALPASVSHSFWKHGGP